MAELLSILLPSFRILHRRRAACSRPITHGSGRGRCMPLLLPGRISIRLVSGLRSAVSPRERYVGVFLGPHSLPCGLRLLTSRYHTWMPHTSRRFTVISRSMANCTMPRVIPPLAAWAHITSSPSSVLRAWSRRSRSPRRVPPPPTLLTAFEHWRDVHRGVTAQTLRHYRPIRLDVLTTFDERPEQLEAKSLRAFILARAHRHGKGHAKNGVTATRMFVRFLIANGHCAPGLDAAIPTIAMWRLSTLPQYLPAEDVERIITACDPSTPIGARDQAIILLMARLGLRGSDVVGLRFPDLNWQDATLVVSGKSRRES